MLATPDNVNGELHERCAAEQVHLIGRIQPHGVLFVLSEPDLIVLHVSENVASEFGQSVKEVLGQPFRNVIAERDFERFLSMARSHRPIISLSIRNGTGVRLNCVAHRSGNALITELTPHPKNDSRLEHNFDGSIEPRLGPEAESADDSALRTLDLEEDIRVPLMNIAAAGSSIAMSAAIVEEIRTLTGFDRVMIYRFDPEWNGEVIAEAKRASLVSYLTLHFPASDIPPQVRQLFLVNTIREIADVDSTSVAIVPGLDQATHRALDLTRSMLRSASPVHLEYLRHMNVRASLTVSILVAGKLWGMLACHHGMPRRLRGDTRLIVELLMQEFASQVFFRSQNEELQGGLQSRRILDQYLADIDVATAYVETGVAQSEQLMRVFEAEGLVWRLSGVARSHGVVPPAALISTIVGRLKSESENSIASSWSLGHADNGRSVGRVGGGLLVELPGGPGDYLLLLRPEIVETITWAGDPAKSVRADEQNNLHPRASFNAWQEEVRGKCIRWSEMDLSNAAFLRRRLEGVERKHKVHVLSQRFHMATVGARIGVYEQDLANGSVWWNAIMYEIFGQSSASFQPTLESWLSKIHPEDRARVRESLGNAQHAKRQPNIRYRVVKPDGSARYIESAASVAGQKADGVQGQIAGICFDVSERVEAEKRERALQERLRESSRQTGMAEIATGVLHNVGNLLNSLGIASTTARREMKALRLEKLQIASELLLDNRDDLAKFLSEGAKGRHLPDYLSALSTQFLATAQTIRSEMDTIDQLLDHLRNVVNAQQAYAQTKGVLEPVNLREVLESALLLQQEEYSRISIEREYEDLPSILTDRHKVLQILVNVISNAFDAVRDSDLQARRVILPLRRESEHLVVSVQDYGVGMTSELLAKIWEFGVTTKPRGHGFGLHNSANAAHQLGATLSAHSDGAGLGALFTLRLPIKGEAVLGLQHPSAASAEK